VWFEGVLRAEATDHGKGGLVPALEKALDTIYASVARQLEANGGPGVLDVLA
jgi:hypothetical protein